jgi:cutinase
MDSFNALVANVWVQGVGDPYLATLDGNNAARGSPERAISEGVRLFMLAQEKCPSTPIVAGGWR